MTQNIVVKNALIATSWYVLSSAILIIFFSGGGDGLSAVFVPIYTTPTVALIAFCIQIIIDKKWLLKNFGLSIVWLVVLVIFLLLTIPKNWIGFADLYGKIF